MLAVPRLYRSRDQGPGNCRKNMLRRTVLFAGCSNKKKFGVPLARSLTLSDSQEWEATLWSKVAIIRFFFKKGFCSPASLYKEKKR